ncbi:hypothetical protein F4776DRAFT_662076 [Hypoxylon sp. NC0597]|nr:hypothetical protein F4776DRAFT_662076 [Hypoxylon sp. NC0597]
MRCSTIPPEGLHGLRGMTGVPLSPSEVVVDGTHHLRYAPPAFVAAGSSSSRDYQVRDVSLFSKECQKRSFNPHFHEWVTAGGNFMCSVDIRGQTVSGIEEYDSPVPLMSNSVARSVSQQ